jgi:acetyl-CoA C-acetyltransferase
MGDAAEAVAQRCAIGRERMDAFALQSHQKAVAAMESGRFFEEIVPIEIKDRKGNSERIDRDEGPRSDASIESLARLKPAFQKEGAVTAGNASGLTDGASAVVLMSREKAEALGLQPLARIVGYTQVAREPRWLFLAPIDAMRMLAEKMQKPLDEIDLFEINEAFAVQVLADSDGLSLPAEKVNVNGGAIALGHPLGASGARVVTTLINALKQRSLKTGIASLCIGGGEAVAMGIEVE